MINYDYMTKKNITGFNLKQSQIPDHRKTNTLFNLIR